VSDDGADLGMTAQDGMEAALGSDEPKQERSPAEFRAMIEADQDPRTYSGCANATALALLGLMEARPELATWPAEVEGAFFYKGTNNLIPRGQHIPYNAEYRRVDDRDLYSELKRTRPDLIRVFEELTGFQWGWAVNAAKTILGQPPVPNPAIVTI
jgi:hypothetical protein